MALQCCAGFILYQHEQPHFPFSLADPIFLPPPVNSVLRKQLDDICWNERAPVWSCNVSINHTAFMYSLFPRGLGFLFITPLLFLASLQGKERASPLVLEPVTVFQNLLFPLKHIIQR